ncbi:hypothetical protein ACWGVR_02985 [Streptomyces xanthophaeus]
MTRARTQPRPCPQREARGGQWLRAVVFTLLSSALAVAGHHLASEDPVPWIRVLCAAAAVLAVAAAAARPGRPWWLVTGATLSSQLLLHAALSMNAPGGGGLVETHSSAEIGYAAHQSPWVMTAAHGAAAGAMTLFIYRADQVISRVPRAMRRWAEAAVATATALFGLRNLHRTNHLRQPAKPPLKSGPGLRAATVMLSHAVVRRGPPTVRAADVVL